MVEDQEDQSKKRVAEATKISNVVSDKTGQFDARFMLWRMFCAENSISVETLPGDLDGEAKEKWDKVKETQLKKPSEEKP